MTDEEVLSAVQGAFREFAEKEKRSNRRVWIFLAVMSCLIFSGWVVWRLDDGPTKSLACDKACVEAGQPGGHWLPIADDSEGCGCDPTPGIRVPFPCDKEEVTK